MENDWLGFIFFLNRSWSAAVPNVLLTGTLLISVYKKKCVLALNFRKCNIFLMEQYLGFFFSKNKKLLWEKMLVLGGRGRKAIFP